MALIWRIEAAVSGREVYYVEADSEEDARARFEDGDLPEPSIAETLEAEIKTIEEATE